ncbi:MAG: Fur family transcriptional regulator [Spirochaetota bacterium]
MGYRLTMPREAILETLTSTDKHLSAEDIYMVVHKKHPAIGLTTVYRTLDILVQMGIIFKFDFGDGRTRYELSEHFSKKKHHHHLICTRCKRIVDYSDFLEDELELINKTEKQLSQKYNFNILGHMIQFYGLCEDCRKQRDNTRTQMNSFSSSAEDFSSSSS